jgi:hypothetical protein
MNVELGVKPRSSFSGNICFEFSVFCLCSVVKEITSKEKQVRSEKLLIFHILSIQTKVYS